MIANGRRIGDDWRGGAHDGGELRLPRPPVSGDSRPALRRILEAMRPLLIGPLVTSVFALTVAYFFWAGAVREWDPNQVDLSKLDEQRHMAECYRVKCGHVGASPVLACAWRELVVEETARSSPVDVTAAEEACRGLSPGSARSPRGPRMNSERRLSRRAARHHG